jgi:predicted permease
MRGLLRTPVFTCTILFTLALTIGASTAIFTAADALLFKPLPVKDPEALVTFALTDAKGRTHHYFPLPFADRLQSSEMFSDVIAVNTKGLSFAYDERTERITGEVVTPNFFSALGLTPVLGRAFAARTGAVNWAPEAVLSYSFWKRRFQGDPQIVGRIIRINTYPFTVVGVAPSSFLDVHQGRDPDIRIPVLPLGQEIPQLEILGANQDFDFIARLAPRVNKAQAQAIANSQLHEFGRSSSDRRYRDAGLGNLLVVPGERGWPELEKEYKIPVIVLFVLVLTATLIACANIASMMLARATSRAKEFAVRSCLGANRSRLITQVLLESHTLSWCGGLGGLAVAYWMAKLLLRFLPQGAIRLALDLQLSAHSILFTFLLCTMAALLFGLTTAVQVMSADLTAAFGRNQSASIGTAGRVRKTLAIVQIALSLTLLVVSGLFIRTVFNLYPNIDYPYAEGTLTFTMQPQQELYSPERVRFVTSEVMRRVASISGIQDVGLAENGPFSGRENRDILQVAGHSPLEVESDVVSPGLLNALGLNIVSGRDFSSSDEPGSPGVVVVSQSVARMLFPNQDPIGRHVQLLSARGSKLHPLNGIPEFQVIGIVGDLHYYDVRRLTPVVFFTFQTDSPYAPTLHVRIASGKPNDFTHVIKREFDAVDTGFPVFNVRTLADRMRDAIARERMIADLSSSLGGFSLFLAGIGIYGVLAYSVARRTREFGIRIALGSTTSGILWLVWRETLLIVGIGTMAGFSLSMIASKLLKNRVYGISPSDPSTVLAAIAILLIIAITATSIPALRASRIDPVIALRFE